MPTATSSDGTPIAYEHAGAGPPIILVDGACCYRRFGPSKAFSAALARRFTVYTYDRRARGQSGNTPPYHPDREIDDLAALIRAAGGRAALLGFSSGAALALDAANHGLPVSRVVCYEPPFIIDDARPPIPADFPARLQAAVDANRRAQAVRMFMSLVGAPAIMVMIMRLTPAWRKLTAVAHTLPYDIGIVAPLQQGRPYPPGRWSGVTAPALIVSGGKSPAWIRNSAAALAAAVPGALHRELPGQTHMVRPAALVPVVNEFVAAA